MGILDFLSGGLTAGTQAAGAAAGANVQAMMMKRQQDIQNLMMARQALLQQAQIHHYGAQDTHLENEDNPSVQGNLAGAKARGEMQPKIDTQVGIAQGTAPIHTQEAIATAQGTAPIKTAQEIATARGTAPIKTAQEIAAAQGIQPLKLEQVRARVQAQNNSAPFGLAAGKAFETQNASLVNGVQLYAQAKNALAQARAGNPAALKSALLSFAASADPKAQLRQGVMHEVMQVDPSVRGRFDLALDRLSKGQIPPRILDDMERLLDQIHNTNKQIYDQRRQSYLTGSPNAAPFIQDANTLFDVPGLSGASSQSPPRGAFDDIPDAKKP